MTAQHVVAIGAVDTKVWVHSARTMVDSAIGEPQPLCGRIMKRFP
jgi:hypothetical protein